MINFAERFFELSHDLLIVGTGYSPVSKLSPSWSTVLGWDMQELTQQSIYGLLHPDDLESTVDMVERSKKGHPVFGFENRYKHKNGTWIWIMWTIVYSEDDALIYACGKDVTRARQVEHRLQLSERRLVAAQKVANIGSWVLELHDLVDMNKNSLSWSDQVFRIFGYQPGEIEVSNQNFFKAVHPDDREKVRAEVAKALVTGEDYDVEHRIVLPDGSERIVHELSEVLKDPKTGRAISMVGTVQDITEQKQFMVNLISAQKLESIGRLAGGIAHDFNNILAATYGNLELMAKYIGENHPAYRYLKSVQATSKRAADLTSQLMAFSRQQVLVPTVQDLNSLVQEAHKILARLLGKDIEIEVSLEPNLGPIEVDASQIIQIILNLAINSRDAMPKGGHLRISTIKEFVSANDPTKPNVQSGKYAKLVVSDDGQGMSTEVLEKIYEPFFTTKNPGAGTGLGLSTVHGIVSQSNGFIFVKSQIEKGTAFEILFPITSKPISKTSNNEFSTLAPSRNGMGLNILLIEDETEIRNVLKEVLEESGYHVFTAEDGRAGIKMIDRHVNEIDLMLTDVVLPGADGFELIRKIRAMNPKVSILCMSGHPTKNARVPLDINNVTYIKKPFHFTDVLAAIQDELIKNS